MDEYMREWEMEEQSGTHLHASSSQEDQFLRACVIHCLGFQMPSYVSVREGKRTSQPKSCCSIATVFEATFYPPLLAF